MLVSSFRVEFEDFRRKGYDAVKIRNFIYESFVLVCYFKSIQMWEGGSGWGRHVNSRTFHFNV